MSNDEADAKVVEGKIDDIDCAVNDIFRELELARSKIEYSFNKARNIRKILTSLRIQLKKKKTNYLTSLTRKDIDHHLTEDQKFRINCMIQDSILETRRVKQEKEANDKMPYKCSECGAGSDRPFTSLVWDGSKARHVAKPCTHCDSCDRNMVKLC